MRSSSTLSQNLKVFYEDNQVIVVFKPHRVLAQGDETQDPSLFDAVKLWLKHKYSKPGNVFLGLVHRLDRPTAGLMVFAKTSKAASRLSEQMRNHSLKKRYRVWVSKELKPTKGTLTHYLDFNEADKKATAHKSPSPVPSSEGAKPLKRLKAVLNYNTLRKEKDLTLLEIELVTGRKHQIRAQLSAIGAPIVGDTKYGSKEKFREGSIALESCYLAFMHPTQNHLIEISIPEAESAIVGGFI